MCSQERADDDSELIDDDDSHIDIHNKHYISKGKDLKTIDSINKNIKIRKQQEPYKKHSRNENQRTPVGRIRCYDRKTSISLLVKPYNCTTKTMAIDAFYDNTKMENLKKIKHFTSKHERDLSKTSKMSGADRNSSNPRLHDRSKSNVNYNRHFQIKHESSNLNSLETFQKLIHNFDIRCSSTENIKVLDRESIDRKASELKKYMSSGVTHAQRINLCKSSRENRVLSYGQDKISNKSMNFTSSDSKIGKRDNDMFYKTSIISQSDILGNSHGRISRLPGVKISSCQLNKVIPFQRLNQIPDIPSIEFDINEWVDDDDLHFSSVTEEIIIEHES